MDDNRRAELMAMGLEPLVDMILQAEEKLAVVDGESMLSAIGSLQDRIMHADKWALLGEMSGNLAHEINNPLLVLVGYANKLRKFHENGEADSEKISKAIERVESMAHRIQKIMKGLLRFARSDSVLEFEKVYVSDLVNETTVVCEQKFKRSGVALKSTPIPEGLSLKCAGVPLSQVLLNLLGNGHDAVEGTEDPWISLEVEHTSEAVIFRVIDSGDGIPLDVQKKIFQKFYTTKSFGKGTGIGLALCAEIVGKHGGKLFIDSNYKNTCFTVEIPKDIKTQAAS
tara:strand:- start:1379 stop:2230 length:852 start_codon:yes stop_codon:yes gene_type:complete